MDALIGPLTLLQLTLKWPTGTDSMMMLFMLQSLTTNASLSSQDGHLKSLPNASSHLPDSIHSLTISTSMMSMVFAIRMDKARVLLLINSNCTNHNRLD